MPELPEVERAVRALRRAVVGKTMASVRTHHPAYARRLSPSARRALVGATVTAVVRRGKHQFIRLSDGRTLQAHFRMTGDWSIGRADDELPRFARASIEFTDHTRVVLEDSRALGTLTVHPAGAELEAALGPEPTDRALTPAALERTLAGKRTAIKVALLDQRVIAGLGNIYAAESLWHARIDPRAAAGSLTRARIVSLLKAIRLVLKRATGARYTETNAAGLAVYDREGKLCHRCRTPIERMVQGGRSTYFCPVCQAE